MATFTFASVAHVFPVGTSVSAYPRSVWPGTLWPPIGPLPAGAAAAATANVAADGSLVFTGLAVDTEYAAYAQVGGVDRYVRCRTKPGPSRRADLWLPSSVIAENMPRQVATQTATPLSSGRLSLSGGMVIPAGERISSLACISGGTGAVTPTAQWFCLVDQALRLLAITADDGATAWPVDTLKTLALAVPYRPDVDTPVFFGIMVAAATVPTLVGVSMTKALAWQQSLPMQGNSSTGLTNPASCPNPVGALTAPTGGIPYCMVL